MFQNFRQARAMMNCVQEEIKRECTNHNTVGKATQFILWEILLIDIHQFHHDWPNDKYLGMHTNVSPNL